jgi:hypothetical protein
MKNCVQFFKFDSIITEIFNLEYWNLYTIRKLAFCMGTHKLKKNFFWNLHFFEKSNNTCSLILCVQQESEGKSMKKFSCKQPIGKYNLFIARISQFFGHSQINTPYWLISTINWLYLPCFILSTRGLCFESDNGYVEPLTISPPIHPYICSLLIHCTIHIHTTTFHKSEIFKCLQKSTHQSYFALFSQLPKMQSHLRSKFESLVRFENLR